VTVDALARDRARLLEVLTERSFERRKVVLSSGKESDFYIDCKRTALLAEGHFLIGRLLLQAVQREAAEAVAVGGLTLGADPLASAVSLTSYLSGTPLHAFIVRPVDRGHEGARSRVASGHPGGRGHHGRLHAQGNRAGSAGRAAGTWGVRVGG
jgi:orotate phosphoribosyltransferase